MIAAIGQHAHASRPDAPLLRSLLRLGPAGRSQPTGATDAVAVAKPVRQSDSVTLSPAARHAAGADHRSDEDQARVEQLEERDRAVRAHEQAHKAAGGGLTGAISYEYTVGPDGGRYVTGGEVPIDTSPVKDDPEATIRKMQQVRRAALAPQDPSAADRSVAAKATQMEREARAAMRTQEPGTGDEATPDSKDAETAVAAYTASGDRPKATIDVLA